MTVLMGCLLALILPTSIFSQNAEQTPTDIAAFSRQIDKLPAAAKQVAVANYSSLNEAQKASLIALANEKAKVTSGKQAHAFNQKMDTWVGKNLSIGAQKAYAEAKSNSKASLNAK